MSTPLQIIDLTGAIVGTQKTLDFSQFVKFNPAVMQEKAHLGLFNESGCGVQLTMSSGNGQYLPAGGWTNIQVEPNDSNMTIKVIYTLPNPPVSMINVVYYAPGETVPTAYTLGNSPIGIGGSVNTSNVQTLSNEGTAAGLLVIDVGDSAFAQLYTLYNDGHSLWAVDQSGVKHQVIKIQTAGNPLLLGQAGDTTEVLGVLLVDQTATFTGDVTLNGAGTGLTVTNNELVSGTLTVTGDTTINGAGVGLNVANNETVGGALVVNGAVTAAAAGTGLAVTNNETIGGTLGVTGLTTATGGIVLPNATFLQIKDHTGAAQNILEVDSGDLVRVFLTSLGDRFYLTDNAGSEVYLDLQANAIILGDATTKLPVTIHGNVNLTDGTLTVSGVSTLAGDVSAVGNVSITTNNKFYKGKDQAGTSYPIAGFNSVTAKQLDILDGTSGQLTNIKSNTKVNGTLESTGTVTCDGTLIVDSTTFLVGASSIDNGAITTDGAGSISALVGLLMSGTLQLTKAATVVNGSSGTCSFYTPIWGTSLKILIVAMDSNYTNASATTFTLPSAVKHCVGIIGGLGSSTARVIAKSGASAVSTFDISTLATAAAAGTVSNPGTGGWFQGSLAVLDSSWDNMSISALTSVNGTMVFIGV